MNDERPFRAIRSSAPGNTPAGAGVNPVGVAKTARKTKRKAEGRARGRGALKP